MAAQRPIRRIRGLGAARSGTEHWLLQRLTAVSNLLLVLWFVMALASLPGTDYALVRGWLASPVTATLMILLVISVFTHARLGVQVVIEDYVHHEGARVASLAAVTLAAVGLAVACIVAILTVLVGS